VPGPGRDLAVLPGPARFGCGGPGRRDVHPVWVRADRDRGSVRDTGGWGGFRLSVCWWGI